jgi:hypothetical protein
VRWQQYKHDACTEEFTVRALLLVKLTGVKTITFFSVLPKVDLGLLLPGGTISGKAL